MQVFTEHIEVSLNLNQKLLLTEESHPSQPINTELN